MNRFSTNPDDAADDAPKPEATPGDRLARHEPFLKGQAKRELGQARIGVASASDFEQDAWLAILEAMRRGKGPPPSPPAEAKYLWTTLVNKIRQAARGTKAEKHGGGTTFVPIEGDEVPGSGTSPSAKVDRKTREDCLERAMASLGPRDQDVLKLTLVEEISRKEIGERLGVSPSYVSRLYREALERLRAAYEANGGTRDSS